MCLDNKNLNEAEEWFNILKNPFGHVEDRPSFSRFYSRHSSSKSPVSINQLFPILPESINTPVTVRHCGKTIVKLTEKFNPGQVPVLTADQPVYALGKQVQWLYPNEFGNIIWMMGPLHIEMFVNIIGTVVKWKWLE